MYTARNSTIAYVPHKMPSLEAYTFMSFVVCLTILAYFLITYFTNMCCGICQYLICFQNDSLIELYNRKLRDQIILKTSYSSSEFEFKNHCDSILPPKQTKLCVGVPYGVPCDNVHDIERAADSHLNNERKDSQPISLGSFKACSSVEKRKFDRDYTEICKSLSKFIQEWCHLFCHLFNKIISVFIKRFLKGKVTDSIDELLHQETVIEFKSIEKMISRSLVEIDKLKDAEVEEKEVLNLNETLNEPLSMENDSDLEVANIFDNKLDDNKEDALEINDIDN